MPSRRSRRIEPISLSMNAFCDGDHGEIGTSWISRLPIMRRASSPQIASRSRKMKRGGQICFPNGTGFVTMRAMLAPTAGK